MYLSWICVELWLKEHTHHRCPGARQWRRVYFAFHSVTRPLTGSQITRPVLKKPMTVFQLHLSAVQTPFKGWTWSPPSQLTFMTVNIVKLFTQTLACTYSIIHRIRKTSPPTPVFNTDRFKAVLLLWFFTVTCSCWPYLYFGSAIMLVTYFLNFR